MLLSHLSQPAASCSYSVVHSALCSAVCVLADCSCCAPSLSLTVAFNQHYGPSHGTYYPSHHHKRFPLNEVSPVSPSCPLFMPSSFLLCILISPSISQSRNIVFFFYNACWVVKGCSDGDYALWVPSTLHVNVSSAPYAEYASAVWSPYHDPCPGYFIEVNKLIPNFRL